MWGYVECILDNDGEGLYMIGWYEFEGVIIVKWLCESYYLKVMFKYWVLELVLLIILVVLGLGMVYLVCNFGDCYLDLICVLF